MVPMEFLGMYSIRVFPPFAKYNGDFSVLMHDVDVGIALVDEGNMIFCAQPSWIKILAVSGFTHAGEPSFALMTSCRP